METAAGLFNGLLIRRLASSLENKTLGEDSLALLLTDVTVLLLEESSPTKPHSALKNGKIVPKANLCTSG